MNTIRALFAAALLAVTPTIVVVHVFGKVDDGIGPAGLATAAEGIHYGATIGGGTAANGTVFSLNASSQYRVIYSFRGGDDGSIPFAPPILVDGVLYGTASEGGTHGENGTVYALDPSTGVERTLYRFAGGADGSRPFSSLLSVGDDLYGTTANGGGEYVGTIFAVNRFSGAERVLHRFRPNQGDGEVPHDSLVIANGTIFGTAPIGGQATTGCIQGCGVIFAVEPVTGREHVVYRFSGGRDGGEPNGLVSVGKMLYGTTMRGGAGCARRYGCGTVFSFDSQSGIERVLYRFHGDQDGLFPLTAPTYASGTIYGVTTGGGGDGCAHNMGCGVVFWVDPSTGREGVIYSFQGGADGAEPNSIEVDGAALVGTTQRGGGSECSNLTGCGTIFRLARP